MDTRTGNIILASVNGGGRGKILTSVAAPPADADGAPADAAVGAPAAHADAVAAPPPADAVGAPAARQAAPPHHVYYLYKNI